MPKEVETRACVLCDEGGATFEESWKVASFVDDEYGTLPQEMVHMVQGPEYWFPEINCTDNEFAERTGASYPFELYGCHMVCYLKWMEGR